MSRKVDTQVLYPPTSTTLQRSLCRCLHHLIVLQVWCFSRVDLVFFYWSVPSSRLAMSLWLFQSLVSLLLRSCFSVNCALPNQLDGFFQDAELVVSMRFNSTSCLSWSVMKTRIQEYCGFGFARQGRKYESLLGAPSFVHLVLVGLACSIPLMNQREREKKLERKIEVTGTGTGTIAQGMIEIEIETEVTETGEAIEATIMRGDEFQKLIFFWLRFLFFIIMSSCTIMPIYSVFNFTDTINSLICLSGLLVKLSWISFVIWEQSSFPVAHVQCFFIVCRWSRDPDHGRDRRDQSHSNSLGRFRDRSRSQSPSESQSLERRRCAAFTVHLSIGLLVICLAKSNSSPIPQKILCFCCFVRLLSPAGWWNNFYSMSLSDLLYRGVSGNVSWSYAQLWTLRSISTSCSKRTSGFDMAPPGAVVVPGAVTGVYYLWSSQLFFPKKDLWRNYYLHDKFSVTKRSSLLFWIPEISW